MMRLLCLFAFFLSSLLSVAQSAGDLSRSVRVYFEYENNDAKLKWLNDPSASQYTVYINDTTALNQLRIIGILDGTENEFLIPDFELNKKYEFVVFKSTNGSVTARSGINVGIEVPATHTRGHYALIIDHTLIGELDNEISTLVEDVSADGWLVDTFHVTRGSSPVALRNRLRTWYTGLGEGHKAALLLGHVPVPYSGEINPDGHGDHRGAWPADSYYADLNGNWSDLNVNNSTASRAINRNIPGDGKFDQSLIPTSSELQVGRVDFHDMSDFSLSELELLRKYLNKNHAFKHKEFNYPRRAIIENNFASFAEGFGQNGLNNYFPMFGPDNVSYGDYDAVLKTDAYLCSYACGAGSYRSAGGIGTTANLFAAHELQTVFTYNFGSYFGDWDAPNNFLRAALGSGNILTNAWAGRPNWHSFSMALGMHIGFSAQVSQYHEAYQGGFGNRFVHIALLGDPSLRLHSMTPPENLTITDNNDGVIKLEWDESADAEEGYLVYRRIGGQGHFQLITTVKDLSYDDSCLPADTLVEYQIKAYKLENSSSGSYYNTSLGVSSSVRPSISFQVVSDYSSSGSFEAVNFEDLSQNATGWMWDFGDGNSSNEQNPMHSYQMEGDYTVCLISDNDVCSGSPLCKVISVVSSLPMVNSNLENVSCYGGDDGSIVLSLDGGDQNSEVSWSDGPTGITRLNLMAGMYQYNIETTTGRMLSDIIEITQPDSFDISINTTGSSGTDGKVALNVSGGTPPYDYTFSPNIVDQDSLAPGDYSVIIIDANDCQTRRDFTIENLTNVDDLIELGISIYPNPVSDHLNIKLQNRFDVYSIEIIDVYGKHLPFNQKRFENSFSLDLSGLNSGVYFVRLSSTRGEFSLPIIKD